MQNKETKSRTSQVATRVKERSDHSAAEAATFIFSFKQPLFDQLRAQESSNERIPAIALTAFVRTEDRSEALEAGFQLHLGKPVHREALLTAVTSLLKKGRGSRSTVCAIEQSLLKGGFVQRYRTRGSRDGLPPGEGVFLACSFWLADCLVLLKRKKEARRLFEKLLRLRNGVGLLSEEYDPRRKHLLGNFPQSFSHIALINTAHNLTREMGPAKQRSSTGHDRLPQSERISSRL